ncbi:MAG: hypothetical protein P8J32_06455, partial [bacterium]|nr:hypothetical protein [bacterium]
MSRKIKKNVTKKRPLFSQIFFFSFVSYLLKTHAMMKMTSLNFGVLKESVAKKASVELARGYEGDTLMKFMETVKKSPALKKQHFVYKNIEMAKPFAKESLAERFLNQNLNLIKGLQ